MSLIFFLNFEFKQFKDSKNFVDEFFYYSTFKKSEKIDKLKEYLMELLFYVESQANCKQNSSKKAQDQENNMEKNSFIISF